MIKAVKGPAHISAGGGGGGQINTQQNKDEIIMLLFYEHLSLLICGPKTPPPLG